MLSAIEVDLGAVHVGRGLHAQHVDDLCRLVRRSEPVQVNVRDDFLGAGRQDRGVDLAGSDGVDADATAAISRVSEASAAFEVE
jgi:hypothetical protein